MSLSPYVSAAEMNINEYRAQFAAYHSSLELARYRYHVGSEPEFRIDRVRADYSDLFSPSALTDLQSHIDQVRAEAQTESTGVRRLLGAARLEHVEIQANEATRELSICESSIHREWSGETGAPEAMSFCLAIEPGKIRRDELARRLTDVVSTCDDLRVTRLHQLHESAGSLGFGSYGDLIAEATGTNLNQVRRDAEALLKQTEDVHRLATATLVARDSSAVAASDLSFADLAYLERLPWLDKFFSLQNWSTIYSEMMRGLGIRVDKQPNLQMVCVTRSPRDRLAACFSVHPPHDVRLVFHSRKGAWDFAASLRAAAQAQLHAWSSKNLAADHPEFIYAQDLATREGYGYLFSLLMLDPKWIFQFLQPVSEAQASELARDVTALLALQVRQLAAETLYAMLLHSVASPSPDHLQAAYVDLNDRATAFHVSPELFLLNLHEGINSAGRLRALAFAAGLREYLRVRYGNCWWTSRKAGDELVDLWNTASRYSVEELTRLIGFGEISFDLIAELLIMSKSGA